jgi:hypothetical protein
MGSVILILSQIYLYTSYFDESCHTKNQTSSDGEKIRRRDEHVKLENSIVTVQESLTLVGEYLIEQLVHEHGMDLLTK